MTLLNLFWSFFQIGLFSIGGGYAAMPLIQNQVVEKQGWLTMSEFADVITISQMTPGPIAINSATFIGTRIAGLEGAIVSTLGCILPSCIIVLGFAFLYKKYRNLDHVQGVLKSLHPAVVGMIASAGLTIIIQALWGEVLTLDTILNIDFIALALIPCCIFFMRKIKLSPIFVMVGAGLIGGIVYRFI